MSNESIIGEYVEDFSGESGWAGLYHVKKCDVNKTEYKNYFESLNVKGLKVVVNPNINKIGGVIWTKTKLFEIN